MWRRVGGRERVERRGERDRDESYGKCDLRRIFFIFLFLGVGRGNSATALSLGAEGIAMGTRLATSKESPLADKTKSAIVSANEVCAVKKKSKFFF
jgi:hypothetical protein